MRRINLCPRLAAYSERVDPFEPVKFSVQDSVSKGTLGRFSRGLRLRRRRPRGDDDGDAGPAVIAATKGSLRELDPDLRRTMAVVAR
jgi:hypothetical protein